MSVDNFFFKGKHRNRKCGPRDRQTYANVVFFFGTLKKMRKYRTKGPKSSIMMNRHNFDTRPDNGKRLFVSYRAGLRVGCHVAGECLRFG